MHMNVWSCSMYQSSLHLIFTCCLLFFYSGTLAWESWLCCVWNVPENYDKLCTLAPTIWAIWDRFYESRKQQLRPSPVLWRLACLWKKTISLSAVNAYFLQSCYKCLHTHFRRWGVAFRTAETISRPAYGCKGMWNRYRHEVGSDHGK